MTEEIRNKPGRKPNPIAAYEKARAFAERARKAAARADDLKVKAEAAAWKAQELAALVPEAEAKESAAYDALQAALADVPVPGA